MNFRTLMMVSALLAAASLTACGDSVEPDVTADIGGTDGGSDAAGDTNTDAGVDPDAGVPDAGDTSGPDAEDPDTGDTSEPDVEDSDAGDDTTDPGDVTDAGDDTTDPGDVTDAGDTTDPGDVTDAGDTTDPGDTTGDTGGDTGGDTTGDTGGDTGGTIVCTAYTPVATLVPETPYTGTLEAGASETSATCGSNGRGPDDMFVIELTAGTWCADALGSNYDTVLHARTQCDSIDSQLACNDDRVGSELLTSEIEFTLDADTTVYLFIDGWAATTGGDYRLNVRPGACVEEEVLCSDGSYAPGEYCNPINSCGEGFEVAECTVFCRDTFESTPGIECDGVADCGDGSDEEDCPFICADGTDTYFDFDICDGDADCTDGTDEADCPEFTCGDGGIIVEGQVCDGDIDCLDATDELECEDYFVCADLTDAISAGFRCDSDEDCADGSDELDCPTFTCGDGGTVLETEVCDITIDCTDGSDEATCEGRFLCANLSRTVPASFICDGDNDCGDLSDETDCPVFTCTDGTEILLDDQCSGFAECADLSDEVGCEGSFFCADGTDVVPDFFVCDGGTPDCADGSDEADCPVFTCGDGEEIPLDWVCDFGEDCADGSDEADCF